MEVYKTKWHDILEELNGCLGLSMGLGWIIGFDEVY